MTVSRWLALRRHLDRVLAAVGALVTAPVVAVLAVAVRRHDGARAIIRVPRVGQGGRTFDMWKIRTMRADGADGRAAGPPLAGAHDDRVTPLGRRLRSVHLDELPQLWNVAAGQMTLFGPRPETPELVDPADERWRAVLSVPPGIAGPTQHWVGDWELELVAACDGDGYRDVVLPVKLAIDRWYLERATPGLDGLVVWSMIRRALRRGRSPSLQHRLLTEVEEARGQQEWRRPPAPRREAGTTPRRRPVASERPLANRSPVSSMLGRVHPGRRP